VKVDEEFYSFERFLKKFDYSPWIIEENIVNGFKQRKNTNKEEWEAATEAVE
jgi:hypothetical protein